MPTTPEEVLADTDSRMQKSVEALQRELNAIRTGRASPALVENMVVEYYGAPTPPESARLHIRARSARADDTAVGQAVHQRRRAQYPHIRTSGL